MSTKIKTKFGNARIDSNGYYRLTIMPDGKSLLLHRRIWEDHYGKPIPKNCVIHHMNGDKLDNRIQNLQCCTRTNHLKFHSKQTTFKHTNEWKQKASKFRKGKNNPMYGRKRSRDEMKGLIWASIKSSKLSHYDNYCGLVYLMHRKHAGLTQMEIISEMGFSSCSYISQKLKRLNLSWSVL